MEPAGIVMPKVFTSDSCQVPYGGWQGKFALVFFGVQRFLQSCAALGTAFSGDTHKRVWRNLGLKRAVGQPLVPEQIKCYGVGFQQRPLYRPRHGRLLHVSSPGTCM